MCYIRMGPQLQLQMQSCCKTTAPKTVLPEEGQNVNAATACWGDGIACGQGHSDGPWGLEGMTGTKTFALQAPLTLPNLSQSAQG